MSCFVNKTALPGNANSCEDVISRTHDLPDAGRGEFIQNTSCARLQFIFEDNKADEVKS